MTGQRSYSYTVLRYVHDVVAGESLNVGVVLHARSEGVLKVKIRKTIGRLKQVFPDINATAFRDTMNAIERGILKRAEMLAENPLSDTRSTARSHALKVLPHDDSSLQWSAVGSGLTADLEKTAERLFQRYVTQHDSAAKHRRTDRDIWKPVHDKLAEKGVDMPFKTRVVAGAQDSIEFKAAWKSGHWHAYEAVSFDLANENDIKDKARRWRGHLAAVKQGNSETVDLHFLLGRPRQDSLMSAYESAQAILSGAPYATEVVDEENTDQFVASIEQEYRESWIPAAALDIPSS